MGNREELELAAGVLSSAERITRIVDLLAMERNVALRALKMIADGEIAATGVQEFARRAIEIARREGGQPVETQLRVVR